MKIINIHIIEFAGLADVKLDFCNGLNVIEGLNESGKSTVNAFIKFMLYGLEKSKCADSSMTEREYYTSWRNGIAQGNMTIEHEGKRYRIERRGVLSTTYRDTCVVYDDSTGEKVFKGREPGEIFLGIASPVYESTCCVRQRELTDVDGKGVSDAIQNMLISADKNIDLDRAVKKLTELRKGLKLQRGDGGRIPTLEKEIENLTVRLEKAERSNAEIRRQRDFAETKRSQIDQFRADLNRVEDDLLAFDGYETLKKFDSLHTMEEKIANIRARIEALETEFEGSGSLPDRQTADTLISFERRIPSAEAECNHAVSLLEQCKSSPAPDALKCRSAEKILAIGGADAAVNRYSKLRKRSKTLLTLAIVFISVGVPLAALGTTLGILLSAFAFIGTGVGAIMVATSVAMFCLRGKSRKALRYHLDICGCYDPRYPEIYTFETFVIDCVKVKRESERIKELSESAEHAYSEKRQALCNILSKTAEALSPFAKAPDAEPENCGEYIKLLNETIRSIYDFCDKRDKLVSDISVEERVLGTMKDALSNKDEELLRSKLTPAISERFASESREALNLKRDYLTKQIQLLDQAREEAEKRLIELESASEDACELSIKLDEKKQELARLRISLAAILMASDTIEKAGVSLRSSVTPRLCEGASRRMSKLTNGKYEGISVDGNASLSITTDMTRDIAVLSCGTRDAAYLSLRFAMIDMLFGNAKPCLTIDEGLAQLDDVRARSLLSVLESYCDDGGQCILFTCHTREAAMLEDMDTKHKKIAI